MASSMDTGEAAIAAAMRQAEIDAQSMPQTGGTPVPAGNAGPLQPGHDGRRAGG
jgi:hypothetical protein